MTEHEILLEIINISNLSQKEICVKTNITESSLSRWVNKKKKPKLSSLISICDKLGLIFKWDLNANTIKSVCDVCGSEDVIEVMHIGENCKRCHPL